MTIIESEQSRDTGLTQIVRGPFVYRFASYRKSEDAKDNLRSEDYIVSDLSPQRASFVLCDGVGSSFHGNIGSQFLGETVLAWLEGQFSGIRFDVTDKTSRQRWQDELTSNLKVELDSRIKLATSLVQKSKLSNESNLISLAEKLQREDFGTQSNFTCGLIITPTVDFPRGLIVLFWLGNARIRIFNNNHELTHLLGWGNNPDQLKEVWSSKDGVIGRVYSYITDLSEITSIIAYSDGLETVEDNIHPDLKAIELHSLVGQAQTIKDDDVSFLEIRAIPRREIDYADDLTRSIREYYTSYGGKNDSNDVRKELENLDIKYNKLVRQYKKDKKILVSLIIFLPIFFLLAGLLIGTILGGQRIAYETPSPTASPTQTSIPFTVTIPTETPVVITPIIMDPLNLNTPTIPPDAGLATITPVIVEDPTPSIVPVTPIIP